ncbi:MAG: SMP-30/gluconolactonase/LRE family protein [Prochlorococcus sp.]
MNEPAGRGPNRWDPSLLLDQSLIAATNKVSAKSIWDNCRLARLVNPQPDNPHGSLDDGKIDRRSRDWCGSMDTKLKGPTASIYRLDPDGLVQAARHNFTSFSATGSPSQPMAS